MDHKNQNNNLLYAPFDSFVHTTFWHKLSQLKLDIDKLDEKIHQVWGTYTCTSPPGVCSIHVDFSSFNRQFQGDLFSLAVYGSVINKNTLQSFKDYNKLQLLEAHGQELLNTIVNGTAMSNPALLSKFILLTYADLKKYHFYYWFAFPALNMPTIKFVEAPKMLQTVFNELQMGQLLEAYKAITDWQQRSFFIVKVKEDCVSIIPLSEIQLLCEVAHSKTTESNTQRYYLTFADPSTLPTNPGWPLRNLLALVVHQCKKLLGQTLHLLALRLQRPPTSHVWSVGSSLILHIQLPDANALPPHVAATWLGWQRNEKGKFGPRLANLSSSMDPVKLAESAVQLNLKLMKWRLVPSLDLDSVSQTRCLLIGSGTLGCVVGRTLLAWGVHNVTFVDSGTVSYSNPVRQSLFTYEDCLHGGRPKSVAAAEALKTIFPGVNAVGHELHIPMPGHTVGDSTLAEVHDTVLKLEKLIQDSDVIFLLTDSRESRWLPTVIAASKNKVVVTAALGFDTFLVMRHGMPSTIDKDSSNQSTSRLGCYFCSDVVAPGNSQTDRTLDQQCTVTRPGMSAIAGALAVELMVSLLQHPLRASAPAEGVGDAAKSPYPQNQCPLGIVPHSIRGFLSSYEQIVSLSYAFQCCIACSDKVVKEYEEHGFNFLLLVFNTPQYLEKLTGLTEIHQQSEEAEVWGFSDISDSESEN